MERLGHSLEDAQRHFPTGMPELLAASVMAQAMDGLGFLHAHNWSLTMSRTNVWVTTETQWKDVFTVHVKITDVAGGKQCDRYQGTGQQARAHDFRHALRMANDLTRDPTSTEQSKVRSVASAYGRAIDAAAHDGSAVAARDHFRHAYEILRMHPPAGRPPTTPPTRSPPVEGTKDHGEDDEDEDPVATICRQR